MSGHEIYLGLYITLDILNWPLGNSRYSRPAIYEWPHLSAVWGNGGTLNIENLVMGSRCGMFGQMIYYEKNIIVAYLCYIWPYNPP